MNGQDQIKEQASEIIDTPAAYNQYGNLLFDSGKYLEAIEQYEKAISADNKFKHAYNNWGLSLERLQKNEEAVEKYRKAIEIDPDFKEAHVNLGWSLECLGKYEDAIQQYKLAIEKDPQYLQAYTNWRDAIKRLTDSKRSLGEYKDAIEKNLDTPDAYNEYGNLLLELGNYADAIDQYKRAIGKDAGYKHAYNNWGIALERFQRFEEAVEKYGKAVEIDAEFKEARSNLEWAMIALGRYEEALDYFRSSAEKDPGDKDAYFGWAYALESYGRYQEAIELYEKSIRIDPDYAYPIHNIAALLEKQGHYRLARLKWDDACNAYEKNLDEEERKRNANYFLYYGSIYQFSTLRDLDKSEGIYKRGLAIDPSNTEILFNLVQLCRMKRNEMYGATVDDSRSSRTEEHFKAREYFRRAEKALLARLDLGRSADVLADLGNLYKEIENFDESKKYFNEALAVDSTHIKSLTSLGAVYMKDEDFKKASELFGKAVELDPENLDLRSNLAEAYLKRGTTERAEMEYRRVLDITPNHMDSLIGIGLTYITMGEDANTRKDGGNAEVMFSTADDYYCRIMRLMQETENASKILNRSERSALFYSKGYNEVMMSEMQKRPDPDRLRTACEDFKKVEPDTPNYYKARRAIAKITERLNPPQGTVDKWGPRLILAFSLVVFVIAQTQFIVGRPVLGFSDYSLDRGKFEEVIKKEKFEPSVKSRLMNKMQQNRTFQGHDNFSAEMKDEFGEKIASLFNPYDLLKGAGSLSVKAFQPLETGYYVLATFGALLFMVAGLYLRQISKLKVGALELEKSSIDQISTSTSLGITR